MHFVRSLQCRLHCTMMDCMPHPEHVLTRSPQPATIQPCSAIGQQADEAQPPGRIGAEAKPAAPPGAALCRHCSQGNQRTRAVSASPVHAAYPLPIAAAA